MPESPAAARTVNCPNCQSQVPWTPQSRYRPFCSERCRLIDLGQWASENYKVASAEPADNFQDQ